MKRLALLALLATTPAAAQNVEDCDGRTFSLRKYPRYTVIVEIKSRDPNVSIGVVHGRCEPGATEISVCANVMRLNRGGYLSDERVVFGVYDAVKGRFVSTLSGQQAPAACMEHVYRD